LTWLRKCCSQTVIGILNLRRSRSSTPSRSVLDWLTDTRKFSLQHHKRAWESVAADVDSSLLLSGPAVRNFVAASWAAFEVDDAVGRAGRSESRAADIDAVTAIRDSLVSDGGLQAAWLDLTTAAERGIVLETRFPVASLRSVLAARGLELSERSRLLAGIMQNRLLDIASAEIETESTRKPVIHDVPEAITASAGRTPSERVSLCAALLLAPPRRADYVVWLAVDRASLPRLELTVGPVQFFDSRYITEVLDLPVADRSAILPREIRDLDGGRALFPSGRTILLARIVMGQRTSSFVISDARRRLLVLLAPSDRVLSQDWTVMPGSVVFRDGHEASWSAFDSVEDQISPSTHTKRIPTRPVASGFAGSSSISSRTTRRQRQRTSWAS